MDPQRLLVVDDDRDTGDVLCIFFAEFSPLYASGVREAKAILHANPSLTCVVSDVMMGDGTGLDLYEWAMQEQRHLKDCFIFMTGGAPQRVLIPLVEAAPVLAKPVDLDKLRGLVHAKIGA